MTDVMTAAEFEKAGGVYEDEPEVMSAADFAAAGGVEDAPEVKPEIHGAGSTFGINALDSASLVGVPAVIGMKDALFGEESAQASKRTDDDDPRFKEKGILDRYRSNKEWLKKGMDRASDESPIAALGGQLAPMLIPGSGSTGVKGAALIGGVHGLLGGDADTAGGDIEGTVKDVAAGAGGGALGSALGSAGGKFLKWVGKKAGSKLEEGISSRASSLLGKYGKKKQEFVGVNRILRNEKVLEGQGPNAVPGPAEKLYSRLKSQFPFMEAAAGRAERGNAGRVVRRQAGSIKRFGGDGDPSVGYARKVALRNMRSQAVSSIKELLGMGVRVGVGSAVGNAVSEKTGLGRGGTGAAFGGAVGGGSRLFVARKLAKNVMEHPDMLAKMASRLPGLGQKLANAGGASGATVGYLTALFATKRGQEALQDVVTEVESEDADVEAAGEGE